MATVKTVSADPEKATNILNRWVLENKYIPWKPSKRQADFLVHLGKDGLYGGAAGGGKSAGQMMAALMFVEFPDYHAILFRRTYPQLSKPDSLIPMSKDLLSHTDAQWNQKQSRWSFPSGATLTFSHMQHKDDKYDHKSAQYQYIGFDEASEFEPDQIRYLHSRLRKSKDNPVPLRFRLTTNPGGPAHDFIKSNYVENTGGDTFYLPARLEHNPHIDTEDYEENLEKLRPVERRRLREGDWDVAVEGEVFKRQWFNVVDEMPELERTVRYWDCAGTKGGGSYTAGVLMGKQEGENEYYVLDVQRFQLDPGERDEMITQQAELDARKHFPDPEIGFEQEPGSSGKKQVQDLQNKLPSHTTFSEKPTGSKENRAGPLASQANLGNINVMNERWTDEFIEELAMFPDGEYDDQVDAASGAFSRMHVDSPNKKVSTPISF